ncbi:hypothetical protein [Sessilibacter corallicola]|uniref:hypothetical protein n=1 Tax=Sessilibacter corallicola TaxID=2904075 RepID=UPI001E3CCE27|nr:hypothetical protein [Sessilibacter corallicola]MCE2029714.1 hypothetical protein [Sessilibacter corallicola]
MNQYQEPPGRFIEVIVGLVTAFITAIFIISLFKFTLSSGLKYVTVIGGLALLFFTYWFGLISYRLLLNRPNKNGGLFSIGGLKFLSAFMGLSFLMIAPIAIYLGNWGLFIGCIGMVVGCFKGWQIAGARGNP